MAEIPEALKADTTAYILYVGNFEAIQSSNPDDASATEPSLPKIQQALDFAFKDIRARDLIACNAGKVLLRSQLCSLQIKIARWYLDTIKQREDIRKEYEKACELLESSCSPEVCNCDPKLDADQAEELGVADLLCPTSIVKAQPRRWKSDPKLAPNFELGTFERGRYLRDR